MDTFLLISAIFSSLYLVFILFLLVSWRGKNTVGGHETNLKVSVIIPLRNESENIPTLMKSLKALDQPAGTEILLVDDHSGDNTAKLCADEAASSGLPQVKVIRLPEGKGGKKAAIEHGISCCGSELILTTDADAVLLPQWIRVMCAPFMNPSTEMVIGPVMCGRPEKMAAAYAALEQNALLTVTRGSANAGIPLLCSGANLAFRRRTFIELDPYMGNRHIASGDDMFLLLKVIRTKRRIVFCSDPAALVTVASPFSWKGLISQKIRWTGKAPAMGSRALNTLSYYLLLLNVLMILTPILSGISGHFTLLSFLPLALKTACDFLLVFLPAFAFRRLPELKWFPPAFVIGMFLVFGLGIMLLTGTSTEWKGRRIST